MTSFEDIPEDIWHAFHACDYFQQASDDAIAEVARASRLVKLAKNERLFSAGDPGDRFGLVIHGRVRAVHFNADGRAFALGMAWPGQGIGTMNAVAGESFRLDIEAAEPSLVAVVPVAALMRLVTSYPDVALDMLREHSHQFFAMVDTMVGMTAGVDCRLARHIVSESDTHGVHKAGRLHVHLQVPRVELAALLGVAPETLSRAFAQLREARLIESDGSQLVTVLDERALAALAANC